MAEALNQAMAKLVQLDTFGAQQQQRKAEESETAACIAAEESAVEGQHKEGS